MLILKEWAYVVHISRRMKDLKLYSSLSNVVEYLPLLFTRLPKSRSSSSSRICGNLPRGSSWRDRDPSNEILTKVYLFLPLLPKIPFSLLLFGWLASWLGFTSCGCFYFCFCFPRTCSHQQHHYRFHYCHKSSCLVTVCYHRRRRSSSTEYLIN